MSSFESFSKGRSSQEKQDEKEVATIEDFADSPQIQYLLRRLPVELQNVHATRIADLSEEDAFGYMHALLERRESIIRESVVSDSALAPYFREHEKEIWNHLETDVFTDSTNALGAGMTARIKKFTLPDAVSGKDVPLAIKYLLTPTEKTLSVSGEHDLLHEVERVQAIEEAEQSLTEKELRIKVPHPYFYYKNGKIQCYAMEHIDGINLEQGIKGEYDDELEARLKLSLAGIDRAALFEQVDEFFTAMHTICLHGDIKPANLMISRDGQFYVIDFGQSILANQINDKAQDAFEVLKQDEKDGTRTALTHFLNALDV